MTESPNTSALNFYAEKPNAFDGEAEELAIVYAAYTGTAWMAASRSEQFRKALASRDVIGQAKGMIMERFKIDGEQAFQFLKRLSQKSNTPLVEVARELTQSDRP